MKQGLDSALSAYKTAHTKSIKRLYRHYPSNLSDEQDFLQSRSHPQLDNRPNEEVFLIYHFCYNIEEFASEQMKLIDAFRAVHDEERSLEAENKSYRDKFRTWAAWVQALDVGNWWGEHTQHVGKTHRWATLKSKLGTRHYTGGVLQPGCTSADGVLFTACFNSATHATLQRQGSLSIPSRGRQGGHVAQRCTGSSA